MSGDDIVERLRRQHTIQYGWRFGELVTHTENNPDPHIVGRMNRCAICEQWSPCDVRDAADVIEARDDEIERLRAAGDALVDAVERQQWSTVDVAMAAWKEASRG